MTGPSHLPSFPRPLSRAAILLAVSGALVLSACHRKQDDGAAQGASSAQAAKSAASAPVSSEAGAPATAASSTAPAAASDAATSQAPSVDVASLAAGAFAVDRKPDDHDWFRLVDGVPDSPGIQVNANPYTLTLALAGNTPIDSFAFAASPQHGVTPHHVKVDVSSAGANGPWTTAYDADFPNAAHADSHTVLKAPLQQPVTARFVRLTLSTPPDQAPYGVGLSRFSAYGTPAPPSDTVRQVAGLYRFPLNFGSSGYVLLQQDGAGVTGCYFESTGDPLRVQKVLGTIVGGFEQGGYLRMSRNDAQSQKSVPGILVFSPDNKQVFSALFKADARTFDSVDESPGERIGPTKLTCDPSGKPDNAVASQLEQTGHVQLYGVNFDLDKSTLRADAKPVLDRMAMLLKAHSDWKIEVAGHTDSTGGDAHNLSLSQARAESVMQYLKQAGVSGTLTARGYGSTQPLVPNTTDALRAQNRRVELVKQ